MGEWGLRAYLQTGSEVHWIRRSAGLRFEVLHVEIAAALPPREKGGNCALRGTSYYWGLGMSAMEKFLPDCLDHLAAANSPCFLLIPW